jgi:hypothetical protein
LSPEFFGIKMMLTLGEEVAQPQHMSETMCTVMGNKRQGSIFIYYVGGGPPRAASFSGEVLRLSSPLPPMPIHSSCPQERSLNQGPDLHGRGVCGINSRFLSVARLYRQELKEIRSTKLRACLVWFC